LEVELTKWGYRVTAVASGAEAWEILQRPDAPRMAILDWMMPGFSGPEVCAKTRQLSLPHYTYILLLTSRHEKEDIIAGMESGADDYLIKPFDGNELKVRLGPGRRIIELQTELLRAQEALRIQATRDALTKVWNRRAIFDILTSELARSRREGKHLGLVMGDIDRFKMINDTYGHIAGDSVLVEVAARMLQAIRPYDSVGRYGGEEFLLILPACDASQTMLTSERMREHLRHAPIQIGATSVTISSSFGATSLAPDLDASPEAIIAIADQALYMAKEEGRNRTILKPFPVPDA
jgi:diguanylate cyclase (GGDEF)-like protein